MGMMEEIETDDEKSGCKLRLGGGGCGDAGTIAIIRRRSDTNGHRKTVESNHEDESGGHKRKNDDLEVEYDDGDQTTMTISNSPTPRSTTPQKQGSATTCTLTTYFTIPHLCLIIFLLLPFIFSQLPARTPPTNTPIPLPLPSRKSPFLLFPHLLLPPILLSISLLIPTTHWVLPVLTLPLLLALHWDTLRRRSRSPAHGFAIGTYVVFHIGQSVVLLFGGVREGWKRWVPSGGAYGEEAKKGGGMEKKGEKEQEEVDSEGRWEEYPWTDFRKRLDWVLELITNMRMVGWDTPISPLGRHCKSPPTKRTPRTKGRDEKKGIPSTSHLISRETLLKTSLIRLLLLWFMGDFAVWNIRYNDTGYWIPMLLHRQLESLPSISLPQRLDQPMFSRDIQTVGAYPSFTFTPLSELSISKLTNGELLVPNTEVYISPEIIPYPRYFFLPKPLTTEDGGEKFENQMSTRSKVGKAYTRILTSRIYKDYFFEPILHATRVIAQGMCLSIGMENGFHMLRSIFMIISLLKYPNTPRKGNPWQQSRWFGTFAWLGTPPNSNGVPSLGSAVGGIGTGGLFNLSTIFCLSPSLGPVTLFWGSIWQQLFRHTFLRLAALLGLLINQFLTFLIPRSFLPTSPPAAQCVRTRTFLRLLMVVTVFIFSGVLHFAGVWTQTEPPPPSHVPGNSALMFFLVQPIAIFIESMFLSSFPNFHSVFPSTPFFTQHTVRRIVGLVWLITWLSITAPLFLNEYRYAGLWRVEAVPVSLWLSVAGTASGKEGWWRWGRERWMGGVGGEGDEWGWWEWVAIWGGERGWGMAL